MTLDSVTIPLAFAAGAASFLSPCVLPLVPVYVSYLVRSSATTTGEVVVSRGVGTVNAISFVAGVSLVFITLF
jgi:cytochrome c-type biogenesis protein